jgi:predicted nuclease of restriction endonuclease-like RecB superfamily
VSNLLLQFTKGKKYINKSFSSNDPELYSENGERMRSKSEVMIANTLLHLGFPYIYEKPLKLKSYGTVYPDFTLWDFQNSCEVYWEHFGMMDDPDYLQKALAKISDYEACGLMLGQRLIITFETMRMPLSSKPLENKLNYLLRCKKPSKW